MTRTSIIITAFGSEVYKNHRATPLTSAAADPTAVKAPVLHINCFMAYFASLTMQTAPHVPPPLPRGIVTGVFLRPPVVTGSTIFERHAQANGVPVALGPFGLEGSQEWHRLEKNAGKLSSTDAADRAVLMQAGPLRPWFPVPPHSRVHSVRGARAAAAARSSFRPHRRRHAAGCGGRRVRGKLAGERVRGLLLGGRDAVHRLTQLVSYFLNAISRVCDEFSACR